MSFKSGDKEYLQGKCWSWSLWYTRWKSSSGSTTFVLEPEGKVQWQIRKNATFSFLEFLHHQALSAEMDHLEDFKVHRRVETRQADQLHRFSPRQQETTKRWTFLALVNYSIFNISCSSFWFLLYRTNWNER